MNVSFSPGNIKMGNIASVSLPSVTTCPNGCPCSIKCYGRKIERLRPSVRDAYRRNLEILQTDPDTYWREVEATVMLSRFFRFHVSGDIPPGCGYLRHMVDIASRNKHCQILCFTKRYDLVNESVEGGLTIPENLHLIFSVWRDYPAPNPHRFPEAHVRYKDGSTTASDSAFECSGNCTECAVTDGGCWSLKYGEQVIFNEH